MKAKDVAQLDNKGSGREFVHVFIVFGVHSVVSGKLIEVYRVGSATMTDAIYCLKYENSLGDTSHFFLQGDDEIILIT